MRFPNYNKVSHVIATCFGVGSIPFAPGTWGSLFTVLLVFNITFLQDWIILVAFLVVALSWWVCVEVYKDTKSDSSEIVIDEFAGMFVACMFINHDLISLTFAFLFFRFFDIVKPWPISWVDKNIKNGPGILIDDLLAGLFAGILMLAISHVIS
jgi:phosphatidylglycerophosphatase A|tara:strand:+ start:541 stop:1002 length:462 start_codon:yes stop_codon:yes gene_type:complete